MTPGAHTLYLSIFDQGDHVLDSAVFVDALVLGTTGDGGCQPGATAVSMDKVVDDSTVGPGDEVTYTITITNVGTADAVLSTITDTLPDGFAYVPGSTTGITTADPDGKADDVGRAAFTVPAERPMSLSASRPRHRTTPGTYFNNASAQGSGVSVTPTGPDAPVTVEETEPEAGNIVVQKETNPDGATQSFTFDPSWGADFQLTDGQQNDSGALAAGTYSVSETVPDGWQLTSAVCSDGSPVSAIALGAGETVTCTFLNTQQQQQQGNIVIQKATDPECASTVFDFTASYDSDGFQLAGCQQNDSGPLAAGTYSVSEAAEPGWELTGTSCSDGSPVSAIDLDPGETVTCTFTNEQLPGSIVVQKETDPDGDPQEFEFTTDYSEPFLLSDGESNPSGDLEPGTYSVSETVPDDWELTSATCSRRQRPVGHRPRRRRDGDLHVLQHVRGRWRRHRQHRHREADDSRRGRSAVRLHHDVRAGVRAFRRPAERLGPAVAGHVHDLGARAAGWVLESIDCGGSFPVDRRVERDGHPQRRGDDHLRLREHRAAAAAAATAASAASASTSATTATATTATTTTSATAAATATATATATASAATTSAGRSRRRSARRAAGGSRAR